MTWQEWDAREKRVQEAKWGDQGSDKEEEGGDDGLPFACYICRCGHNFPTALTAPGCLPEDGSDASCPRAAGSHGRRWRTR